MDMTRLAQGEQAPKPISWEAAFQYELAALGPAARPDRLHALCLSGGGVRSAAYCLGVLQALACAGRLTGFHYLSTVSGGGYIGAWLQTTIRRHGAAAAQDRLARRDPAAPGQDPPELQRLRRYTNWLTPNGGLLSLDGWTGVAMYLRNVLLNWLVFGPLFLLAALLAVAARTGFFVLQGVPEGLQRALAPIRLQPSVAVAFLFLLAGLLGLAWSTVESCKGLPSRRPRRAGVPDYWAPRAILRRIVVPSLVWAFCIPFAVAPAWGWVLQGPAWARAALPLLFAGGSIAGYLAAAVTRTAGTPSYWNNLAPWCLASLAGAGMIHAGLLIARALPDDRAGEIMVIAGPAWLLLSYAVLSAVHAGLRGAPGAPWSRHAADAFCDLDIEWMARITAMRLRIGLAWGAVAFCALTLERLLIDPASRIALLEPAWLAALAAGPALAWLAKQAFSRVDALLSGRPRLITWDLLLRAASLAFAAAVLAGSSVVVATVLTRLQGWISAEGYGNPLVWMAGAQAAFGGAMLLVLYCADNWIRTNRFSMHGVYRDRLVRAFVGPARAEASDPGPGGDPRHPDPFTGFDPGDNPPLSALVPDGGRCLFPVINVTLNLSASRRADWADRKAAPFTLTPLHCGAAHLDRRSGQYVATGRYAGSGADGISLGTAMAVSGAAVSPNWGYHSSGLTAFIMTLFNVRLGAWLPNPACPQRGSDRSAPGWRMLLGELLAQTDDDRDYVYLSDGGHFDNLGLYEMLRRRCRLIAVVDATRDPDGGRADLGAAIGKARIDMGVQVRMECAGPGADGLSMGVIRYPDGMRGVLLVLRPVLTGSEPVDVRAFHAQDSSFPNEATTEQWFTEAQFESHRALGAHQAGLALDRLQRHGARRSLLMLRAGGAETRGPIAMPLKGWDSQQERTVLERPQADWNRKSPCV